jgi:hypothetical protein
VQSPARQETDESHKQAQKAQKIFFEVFVPFVLFCGCFFLVDERANAGRYESGSTLMVGQPYDQPCSAARAWRGAARRAYTFFESEPARIGSFG